MSGTPLATSPVASMGPRSENRGYSPIRSSRNCGNCFNGSTVREPWLLVAEVERLLEEAQASMGPRSENRGYQIAVALVWCQGQVASMGPRSENRGYVAGPGQRPGRDRLQWVHGPRTVVIVGVVQRIEQGKTASMGPRSENRGYGNPQGPAGAEPRGFNGSTVREPWLSWMIPESSLPRLVLQWVHGPRTVVMRRHGRLRRLHEASMGPRSENRGYFRSHRGPARNWHSFNGSTVREPWLFLATGWPVSPDCCASMGPRSENRGYRSSSRRRTSRCELQWVHGPRTVVIPQAGHAQAGQGPASMGPRSENRGYPTVHAKSVLQSL